MDLNHLITDYSDLLYNFTRTRLRNSEEIEDVIQDTFLSAIESWDRFQGKSSVSTWLIGILKFKILDVYKRNYKQAKVISESDLKSLPFNASGNWIQSQADPRKTTEEKLESQFIWDSLIGCVEHMPTQHQVLFKLREFENLPTKLICKTLNLSISNLHVLMHRIRLQLKGCLEGKGITRV